MTHYPKSENINKTLKNKLNFVIDVIWFSKQSDQLFDTINISKDYVHFILIMSFGFTSILWVFVKHQKLWGFAGLLFENKGSPVCKRLRTTGLRH